VKDDTARIVKTEIDHIAILQGVAHVTFAIHEEAASLPFIFDRICSRLPGDRSGVPGDSGVIQLEVVPRAAAPDQKWRSVDGHAAVRVIGKDDFENRVVCCLGTQGGGL
jgi:hypothetical protein